jgi:hypothetical protein
MSRKNQRISSKTKKLERMGFVAIAQKDKNNCLVCTGCNSCTDGAGGGEGNG